MDFEDILTRFASASEKRHNETDAALREQQAMMKEHQALNEKSASLDTQYREATRATFEGKSMSGHQADFQAIPSKTRE